MIGLATSLSRHGWFTLADGLAQRRDNFLLLRIIAAAMVIYGHGFAVTRHPGQSDFFMAQGWGAYSGTIAVDMFFVISGFMITGSYLRRGNVLDYLWARGLRVVPAYAVCVFACAFVLGAVFTSLPLSDYLSDPATRGYAFVNMKFGTNLHWNLPGVFTENPRRTTVNGSLWTLPAEVRMYLWAALLGVLGILARRRFATFLLLALIGAGALAPDYIPLLPIRMFLRPAGMFALGALCYLHRERIPTNLLLVVTLAGACWILRPTPIYPYAFALALAAFVFWFAYRLPLFGYNRFGDYSYGLYLWGYPVQQSVVHLWPTMTVYQNIAISLPIALMLGVLSWYAIEKPALALKRWPGQLPGYMPRGWATRITVLRTRCRAIAATPLRASFPATEPTSGIDHADEAAPSVSATGR
jgi:peptidoglycan/LPS O-acetylase OafA/YrhL